MVRVTMCDGGGELHQAFDSSASRHFPFTPRDGFVLNRLCNDILQRKSTYQLNLTCSRIPQYTWKK